MRLGADQRHLLRGFLLLITLFLAWSMSVAGTSKRLLFYHFYEGRTFMIDLLSAYHDPLINYSC